MSDLRDRLAKLSERADVARDAWDRFAGARRRHERRRRVATAGISLAVASTGIFGVWGAFRSAAPPSPRTSPTSGERAAPFLSLWPQRSIELGPALLPDVGLAQRRADSGNPDATWQLSPTEIASRFATEVMGWPKVVVASMTTGPDGSVVVTVGYGAASCTQVNGQTFQTNPPSPGECLSLAMGHEITLVQPAVTGPSGIWEVVEVHPVTSSEFDLGVGRGQTLTAGQTLNFDFGDVPPGAIGLVASFDCAAPLDVVGTIHVDPNHSSGTVLVPTDLTAHGECIAPSPNGYLYAYSVSPPSNVVGDPFKLKSTAQIGEIAIVPVVLSASGT